MPTYVRNALADLFDTIPVKVKKAVEKLTVQGTCLMHSLSQRQAFEFGSHVRTGKGAIPSIRDYCLQILRVNFKEVWFCPNAVVIRDIPFRSTIQRRNGNAGWIPRPMSKAWQR